MKASALGAEAQSGSAVAGDVGGAMVRSFVQTSLRFRLLVVLGALAVVAFGVVQLPKAPVDALPEFAPPYVEVQTEALGLSATEVEQLITAPMEADLLSQVAFLDRIESDSVPGMSSIQLYFEPGTDELEARQLVQERLTEAHALPRVSKPPAMLQPVSATNRVLVVGLSADDLSLIEMSVLARWNIRPRLMGVPGVANVAIFGQREQQLQVRVDPRRLADHGVQLDQVVRTTANALWVSPLSFVEASTPGTGGFVETPNQRIGIQHVLPITTPNDLEQVVLEGTGGRTLRLGDVTSVRQDHQPLIGDGVIEDQPSLVLVIEKFPGTDTAAVTAGVEQALDELRPGLPGMTIDTTVYRPASFLATAMDNLGLTGLIGLLLGVVGVGALQRSWRAMVVCLVALPLALLAAVLVLYASGATLNALVAGGLLLAVAVLVDDAVLHAHGRPRAGTRRDREAAGPVGDSDVVDAFVSSRAGLGYGSLVLATATVPVLLVGGLTGELLQPMVLAYLAAMAASVVVASTVTPVLVRWLLPPTPGTPRSDPSSRLRSRAESVLRGSAQRPRRGYAVVATVLVLGVAAWPLLGARTTVPAFADRDLLVSWAGPPGMSLTEMDRITAAATSELRDVIGVRNVGAHVGRAITGDQVGDVDSGQLWLSIEDGADYDTTVSAVRAVLAGYPGMDHELGTYAEDRLVAAEGDTSPLVVRVFGEEYDELSAKATEVQRLLDQSDRVTAPRITLPVVRPTVEVEVDLARAERFGVKPGDVRRAAATMLSGIEVGSLFEQQKVFEVIVVGATATRQSLADVDNLLIDTPGGEQVRLADVADVRVEPNPDRIEHSSVLRHVDVVADVTDGSEQAAAADVETILEEVDFDLGYHAEVLSFAPVAQTDLRPLSYYGATVLVILLLLQAAFGSWRLAAMVLTLLATAGVGVLAAIALLGGTVATTTILAVLAVVGLGARTNVLLVRDIQRLEAADSGSDRVGAVVRATSERLSPVVTSALGTVLILLPFAVRPASAGLELVHPLAVAVIGGVAVSTLMSLIVLPALYLRVAPRVRPGDDADLALSSRPNRPEAETPHAQ